MVVDAVVSFDGNTVPVASGGGERVSALALEAGVLRKSLYEWRAAYRAFGATGLNRKRGPKARAATAARPSSPDDLAAAARPPDTGPPYDLTPAEARIAELERLVGRQQADLDFFQEALRSWDATSPKRRRAHLLRRRRNDDPPRTARRTQRDARIRASRAPSPAFRGPSYYRWLEPGSPPATTRTCAT